MTQVVARDRRPSTHDDPTRPDQTRPDVIAAPSDAGGSRMADACRHTFKKCPPGVWVRGSNETPGIVYMSNGQIQVKMQCNACGHRTGPLPLAVVRDWRIRADEYGWSKTNDPISHQPCVVRGCGATPTEWHHFAPWNTFGIEAERWPVLPLCRPHHVEWHTRMDGYRRNGRAVA